MVMGVVVHVGTAPPEGVRVKDEDHVKGPAHARDEVARGIDHDFAEEVLAELLAVAAAGGKDGYVHGDASAEVIHPMVVMDQCVDEIVVNKGAGEVVEHAHVLAALPIALECGEHLALIGAERERAEPQEPVKVVGQCVERLMDGGAFHLPQK